MYLYKIFKTNLCLSSQIGAGYSYLDCIKNKLKNNKNNENNERKINENELLYQASPLPLRPEDVTIKNKIKLKKIQRQSDLLIASQMFCVLCNCVIVFNY